VPWERLTIPLSEDLLLGAEFEVTKGVVKEFRIALLRLEEDGSSEWLVRYETHGSTAHKHERWDDQGEDRHKRPKAWQGTHAELVTAAIHDIQKRFEEYEGRFKAWKQSNASE
jgi:hypothetical protein